MDVQAGPKWNAKAQEMIAMLGGGTVCADIGAREVFSFFHFVDMWDLLWGLDGSRQG